MTIQLKRTAHILLIEDDEETLRGLANSFTRFTGRYGTEDVKYEVTMARTRYDGYILGRDMHEIDGAVIDSKLPFDTEALKRGKEPEDFDLHGGAWILRRWRKEGVYFPAIMASGAVDHYDEVVGDLLGQGAATFFVQKLYWAERELVQPMHNLIFPLPHGGILTIGDYSLDRDLGQLDIDGKILSLTDAECALVEILMQNDGKRVSKRRLRIKLHRASNNSLERLRTDLRNKFRKANVEFPIRTVRKNDSVPEGAYHGQFLIRRDPR